MSRESEKDREKSDYEDLRERINLVTVVGIIIAALIFVIVSAKYVN